MTAKRVQSVGAGLSLLTLLVLGVNGCASDPPKPTPAVTPDHVRSHSDKAFQKLQHEEHQPAVDQSVPR